MLLVNTIQKVNTKVLMKRLYFKDQRGWELLGSPNTGHEWKKNGLANADNQKYCDGSNFDSTILPRNLLGVQPNKKYFISFEILSIISGY